MEVTPPSPLSRPLIFLLAAGAGFSAACLYYAQPLLGMLTLEFQAEETTISLIPALTQLGYALGLFFLAPLSDRYDRKKIILIKLSLLIAALLFGGLTPHVGGLILASFAIGLTATAAQDYVPAAATLAPAHLRGKTVGSVMTGLLLGILLSRVLSGFVAEHFGWRAMYALGTASIIVLGLATWIKLPSFAPTTTSPYFSLIKSMGTLWKAHAPLRYATYTQALLSVAFSAFWSTLSILLYERYQLGAATAGVFGLAGAAGAIAAPLAGRFADRKGPQVVTIFGSALTTFSFVVLIALPVLSVPLQISLLVMTAILFDFGIQAVMVPHQTIIYSIAPEARSRLNAILITGMFLGMAIGSSLGISAYHRAGLTGWIAVTAISCALATFIRVAVYRWPHRLL